MAYKRPALVEGETPLDKELFENICDGIDELKSPVMSAKIFMRVGCIGDSYTAGYILTDAESQPTNTYPDYSWVTHMNSLTGRRWDNYGKGGSSTKSWMNGGAKLSEVQAEGNKAQAYIIGLGINDISNAATKVGLGTAEDIGTDNDSYYAYYYKLIKAVNAVNPTAPIFCNTLPQLDRLSKAASYNQAIKDVVAYCHDTESLPVFVCDLAGEYAGLYSHPVFSYDYIKSHYTAIGYEFMAELYLRVLSDVINKNYDELKAVHKIPYDAN